MNLLVMVTAITAGASISSKAEVIGPEIGYVIPGTGLARLPIDLSLSC